MHHHDIRRPRAASFVIVGAVGAFATVGYVGLGHLAHAGNDQACLDSLQASVAGADAYCTSEGVYPATFAEMTGAHPADLVLPASVGLAGSSVTNGVWTLTMRSGTRGAAPTFVCS